MVSVTAVIGIYSWIRLFQLQIFEYFFYFSFINTLYGYINSVVIQIASNQSFMNILVFIVLNGLAYFYILSVIYSFLLEKEAEYRKQRKKYDKIHKEAQNELNSSLNP